MAKYLEPPKTLAEADQKFIRTLRETVEKVFAGKIFGEGNTDWPSSSSVTTTDGLYHWDKTADFGEYVLTLTGKENIRAASNYLYETKTETPEYSEPTTTQNIETTDTNAKAFRSDELSDFTRKAEAIEKARQEGVEKAIRDTKAFLDQQKQRVERLQQRIQALEKKEIYVKVKEPIKVEEVSKKEEKFESFKEQIKADPEKAFETLSEDINERTLPAKPVDVEVEDLKLASQVAAVNIVKETADKKEIIRNAVINKIATDSAILDELKIDEVTQEEVKTAVKTLVEVREQQLKFSKEIVTAAFEEDLSSRFFNPEKLSPSNFEFSLTPQEGFQKVDLSEIVTEQTNSINFQSDFTNDLKNLTEREMLSHVRMGTQKWLNGQISKLSPDSLASKLFNNDIFKGVLSEYGIGSTTSLSVLSPTNFIGKLAISAGYGEPLMMISEFTGFDFGITRIAIGGLPEIGAGGGVAASVESVAVATATTTATGAAEVGATAAASAATTAAVGATAAIETGAVGTAVAAGAATGPAAPFTIPVFATIAAVAGPKIKDFVSSVVRWVRGSDLGKMIIVAPLGLAAVAVGGGIFGFLGVTALAYGGLQLASGGLSAIQTSLSGMMGGIRGILSTLGSIAFPAIGGPILMVLLVFPFIVALILFIINSGAYIVPPSIATQTSDNPYIDVLKTATPAGPFENSDLPLKVTYTITVKSKKGNLANIRFRHECKVVTKGSQGDCPAPTPIEPETIGPSSAFTFTYDANYSGNNYRDSLVINSFEVIADVPEEKNVTTSSSATISIGKPPSDCLKVDGPWPATYKANIESAVGQLVGKHSNYVAKVCSAFPEGLPLRFNPSGHGNYWGWNRRVYIDFYQLGVKNQADALYTLAHELGHSLIWGVGGIFPSYRSFPGIKNETPVCFYSYGGDINEKLPEAIAFHVISPRCGSVQTKYPAHYKFIIQNVFN